MLTSNLKKIIDQKWDNCWPVSNLRPIAILDLISYIFFIKKLDDRDLIKKNLSTLKSGHFTYTKEIEEFTWAVFKDMDAPAIHDLFTKQFGIIDLMSEYGQSNSLYSQFFGNSLLLKPTPKLLLNVIEIINLIESCDAATQSAIMEYLLSKAEKAEKEQQFIPQFISRLMISICEPRSDDIICDISAGNGSLLINAAEYIENKNSPFKQNLSSRLKGLESNSSQLRIAAMRMILHGIKEPDLQILSSNVNLNKKPTVFISDLLQKGIEDNIIPEADTPQPENVEKEIILLNEIVKNLHAGSRAVVLVPENLLKNNLPEIQKIRKEIVDNTNLEGVIHLFPNSKSFSAAGILIFNKQNSETTNDVWFCKMEKPKKRRTVNETFKNPEQNEVLLSEELSQANIILDNWKNRKDTSNRNSFFINAYNIKTNSYNLNFNDYKLISSNQPVDNALQKTESEPDENDTIVATKKESLHHFFDGAAPLEEPKRKRKVLPAILLILLVIIAGGWVYLNYFKNDMKLYLPRTTVSDSAKTLSKTPLHTSTTEVKTEPSNIKKAAASKEILPAENKPQNATTGQDSSQGYTVINKAWFHSAPDSSKRKSLFLQPRPDLVLIPTAEENGFVYVVYVNKKGQPTRGWLDKKDLEPVE